MIDVTNEASPYRSPLLALPGAAEIAEAAHPAQMGVAWHYGNPLVEQQVFEAGLGLVDQSNRVVFRVSGEDTGPFLNNLLSQKLAPLEPLSPHTAQALDLDAQGRILHQMGLCVLPADATSPAAVLLDVAAPSADSLEQYLTRMVFWSKVTIERTTLGMLSLVGAGAGSLNEAQLAEHLAQLLDGHPWYSRQADELTTPRLDLFFERSALLDVAKSLTAALDARPTGLMAYTAERVRAVEPEATIDLDAKSIPHESPRLLAHGVHLNKGCYRGQETVARVDNLGRSPRLLVRVHLDGSAPQLPATNDPITVGTSGGRAVGRIGTVVHDYEYGPVALALVKRSALQGTTALFVGEAQLIVDQDSIPREDGVQAGRAAIQRLKGLG